MYTVVMPAPFLKFDDDACIVLAGGRPWWIIYAYTTSAFYPYSEPFVPTGNIEAVREVEPAIVAPETGARVPAAGWFAGAMRRSRPAWRRWEKNAAGMPPTPSNGSNRHCPSSRRSWAREPDVRGRTPPPTVRRQRMGGLTGPGRGPDRL